jgi:myo-inositol catabolism protein IolC
LNQVGTNSRNQRCPLSEEISIDHRLEFDNIAKSLAVAETSIIKLTEFVHLIADQVASVVASSDTAKLVIASQAFNRVTLAGIGLQKVLIPLLDCILLSLV